MEGYPKNDHLRQQPYHVATLLQVGTLYLGTPKILKNRSNYKDHRPGKENGQMIWNNG